jgi:hypothetical protein
MKPETIMVREQGFSTREARASIRIPRGHAQQMSREYCSPGGYDGSVVVAQAWMETPRQTESMQHTMNAGDLQVHSAFFACVTIKSTRQSIVVTTLGSSAHCVAVMRIGGGKSMFFLPVPELL